MALPAYPNAISLNAVNVELGAATATTLISLNDAAVRALFVRASGEISFSHGHGKSAVVDTMPLIAEGTYSSATDRTIGADVIISGNNLNDSVGPISNIGNFTVTGGNITYVWQFHTGQVFDVGYPANMSCPNPHDQVYGSYTSFGNDSWDFGNTHFNFGTAQLKPGSSNDHGVQGYWRLKVTNSIGTRYSHWIHVIKKWGVYSFNCGCSCDCTCDCDENDENCTSCCDGCCDTCYEYTYQSSAQTDWCA